MKLKILGLIAISLVAVSISTAEALPTYTVSNTPGRIGNGGPFEIVGNGLDFQSFCVETQEYITLPGKYWGSIDPVVIYTSSASFSHTDPIADNTARLYNYFLDNYASLSYNDKHLIQIAIWTYQNQPGYTTPPVGNTFYDHAPTYPMTQHIVALNLWTSDVGDGPYTNYLNSTDFRYRAQTQLFADPAVPEPGILTLLGIGLSSVALLARRKKDAL